MDNVDLSMPSLLEPESASNGIRSGGRRLNIMSSQNILVLFDIAVQYFAS